jgi:LacI family transcriptional regulator
MGLRCPEDFGLVSFDDYPWLGVFRPRLTTVELPKHQLGSEAAELLIRRISGDRSAAVVKKLQPELRIRESCGFALSMSRTPSAEPVVSALDAPLIREAK